MSHSDLRQVLRRYSGPRYWALKVGIALTRYISRMPLATQFRIGRWLGTLLRLVSPQRRHIARVNLALCFPELSAEQHRLLLRRHFQSLGIAVVETAMVWWLAPERLRTLGRLEGREHVENALRLGKGVILLGSHVTTIEICGTIIATHIPFCVTYRKHKNPLVDELIAESRRARFEEVIPHGNTRAMLRALKSNKVVWYSPDQNYAGKHSVFAPFFGVPAATMTATSHIARLSGAPVVPLVLERLADGYRVVFEPPLSDFPSDDIQRDTERVNEVIAATVNNVPEQYLWIHRRFKTRPEGEPSVY